MPSMDEEDNEDERAKWTKERQKVLDEWSEIELKGADALKLDITEQPDPAQMGTIQPEMILEDLYPRLVGIQSADVENDKLDASTVIRDATPVSTFDRILQICLCRPSKITLPPMIYTHKTLLIKLADIQYDNDNYFHWLMLNDYFKSVAHLALDTPDVPCPRSGPHWQIVGFQGNNPATDFRGCGILALLQLHSFTQKLPSSILKAVVQLSRKEPNDFPLAVVSINITSLILTNLKKDKLDEIGTPEEGIYPTIAAIHAGCIAYFCTCYSFHNLTIGVSNQLLAEINSILEKSPKMFLAYLDPNKQEVKTLCDAQNTQ